MNPLLLTFYGDDFTGSTDALEQLTLAGIRAVLFIAPPTRKQLARFKNLQAIGVAGMTRSMTPDAMERELRPAFKKLKALGARHVHYKVCSTFDSSPTIGSIGRVIDVGSQVFHAPFIPLLVAAPALGRHCVFGNLFAKFGIGSSGAIHRLDRHPSISRHPVTPMQEADLRLHLAKQTKKCIGLFDILKLRLPGNEVAAALKRIVADGAEVVLFDALYDEQMSSIGELIDSYANHRKPLFSVGSSGIEMALGAYWATRLNIGGIRSESAPTRPRNQSGQTSAANRPLLVASGSCSAVTAGQISWAIKHGFADVAIDTAAVVAGNDDEVIRKTARVVAQHLRSGRSVIIHTGRGDSDKRVAAATHILEKRRLTQAAGAKIIGSVLGRICLETIEQTNVSRVCVAGGDTSSFAARALGIEALEMIGSLTPGAPLCRADAPASPIDGMEVVFKGGQVGGENYFEIVRRSL